MTTVTKSIVLLVIVVLIIAALLSGTIMSQVKEPEFKVIKEDGSIQIREYVPVIAAQVLMNGERDKAINNGFKILANYIFGNNTSKQKIAMTAPVTQQVNEKIAMTAPVIQQQVDNKSWKVQFIMPANYNLETLPTPNDPRVKIVPIASKKYVVIRFSGMSSKNNLETHLEKLRHYISANHLKTIGEPVLAFYNPPWTLPFLRRNEIMLELEL